MAKEDFKRLGYKEIVEADNTDNGSREQNDSTKT